MYFCIYMCLNCLIWKHFFDKENFAATGKVVARKHGEKELLLAVWVPKNGLECGRTGKKLEQHDMPAASSLWPGHDDDDDVAAGVIDPVKPKVCAPKMYKKRGRCRSQSGCCCCRCCCSCHTRLSWRGMSTGSQGCYGNIWESAHTHAAISVCVRVRRFGSAYTCSLLIRHVVRSQKP